MAEGYKRTITVKQAADFAMMLNDDIKKVGVFIDQPIELIEDMLKKGVIDLVQLHGNEDNVYIRKLKDKIGTGNNIIKAVRVKDGKDIKRAVEYESDYLLLDAYSDVGAGGNGITFDWTLIRNIKKRFFLAGGISVDNVSDAVNRVNPYAVDVSSSLETDGFKDYEKMKLFMDVVKCE